MIVWFYHRVLPEYGPAAVNKRNFEKQIGFLKKSGYEFIDTAGLHNCFLNPDLFKKKSVMITFDDGWTDNYIWATPILAKFAVKAVLALNTGLLDDSGTRLRTVDDFKVADSKTALHGASYRKDFSSFLNWNELREMKRSGIWDIQAHGDSHVGCYQSLENIRGFYPEKKHWTMEYALGETPFDGAPRTKFISTLSSPKTVLSQELREKLRNSQNDSERFKICRDFKDPVKNLETEDEFIRRVKADLSACKEKIRKNLGIEADSFFWPWGHSSALSRKIAVDCGYKMLFTTEKAPVNRKTSPEMIPRIPASAKSAEFILQNMVFSNPCLYLARKLF